MQIGASMPSIGAVTLQMMPWKVTVNLHKKTCHIMSTNNPSIGAVTLELAKLKAIVKFHLKLIMYSA